MCHTVLFCPFTTSRPSDQNRRVRRTDLRVRSPTNSASWVHRTAQRRQGEITKNGFGSWGSGYHCRRWLTLPDKKTNNNVGCRRYERITSVCVLRGEQFGFKTTSRWWR
jgi:hypothetical protein